MFVISYISIYFFLDIILNNLASFSSITDIELLLRIFMKYQFLANYGKLMFLTVVKGYTDSYAGFVAVSDDISSKTDHARFISK